MHNYCSCGEPSPAVKATLRDGTTAMLHPLLTREGEDPGAGGIVCRPKPSVVLGGKELPYCATIVGKP